MNFGDKLLSLRKQKGLSQEELGGELNVSRQTISKWELGDSTPDFDKLILISEFFDKSLDELVKGKNSQNKNKESGNFEPKSKESDKGLYDILILLSKIFGVILLIDLLIMVIYFIFNGAPS